MIEYAKRELARIEHDEEGIQDLMDKCILELIEVFQAQGHTNHSARYVLRLFERLANFKPIQPLTGEDDEWKEEECEFLKGMHQNKRCSTVFKDKDGRAFDCEGRVFSRDGETWFLSKDSDVYIEFPYFVPDEPERVILSEEDDA